MVSCRFELFLSRIPPSPYARQQDRNAKVPMLRRAWSRRHILSTAELRGFSRITRSPGAVSIGLGARSWLAELRSRNDRMTACSKVNPTNLSWPQADSPVNLHFVSALVRDVGHNLKSLRWTCFGTVQIPQRAKPAAD
jgi:hypothetical protein